MSTLKCKVEAIWIRYESRIFNYIRKRVRDKEDCKDILHTVLLKIYNYCEKEAAVRNLSAWLYQVTHNTIVDYYKKKSSYVELPEDLIFREFPEPRLLASYWVVPLLSQLPKKYATPLLLSDIEGIRQQEVAEKLGLSVSATKSRLRRARQLLKQKFEECGVIQVDRYQHFIFTVTKSCCYSLVK